MVLKIYQYGSKQYVVKATQELLTRFVNEITIIEGDKTIPVFDEEVEIVSKNPNEESKAELN